MTIARPRPLVLLILDGWGERPERSDNAIRLAKTPVVDSLFAIYPHTLIGTSGPDVGLPPGQMGNSEVGHLNFGAGRIAMMDISRIDNAIYDGTLADNDVIRNLLGYLNQSGGKFHLFGLVSDGGVHSLLTHAAALIDMAASRSIPVVVHAFLDGRDVQPLTAPTYVRELETHLRNKGIIGTVSGRYWAMDRDNRWERVQNAYRAIVHGEGERVASAEEGIINSYKLGKTDEFVLPFVVGDYHGIDTKKDAGLHFNFRPDRARELSRALAGDTFDAFPRSAGKPLLRYACMTTYDASLGLPIAFPRESFADIFPEVLARAHLRQFRCAETEKYAHVTYFFNGGREEPFDGEDRSMLPSAKDVPTYDLKPEMSADAVSDAVVLAIESNTYDFILVNFANPDMVGHTGVLEAAIVAVEAVDRGVGRIVEAARKQQGAVLVTADHGNCELMKDPVTGNPHTSHTTNPVPLILVDDQRRTQNLRDKGRICDVAPTMLRLLGLPKPAAMTGVSLLDG